MKRALAALLMVLVGCGDSPTGFAGTWTGDVHGEDLVLGFTEACVAGNSIIGQANYWSVEGGWRWGDYAGWVKVDDPHSLVGLVDTSLILGTKPDGWWTGLPPGSTAVRLEMHASPPMPSVLQATLTGGWHAISFDRVSVRLTRRPGS
jgi:hypothetical protein